MSKESRLTNIFLASPGDVAEERKAVVNVIRELNLTLGPASNAVFRLLRWETDVHPDVGTDAQDVINSQIGDDYDLLIGVFWGRIGTATPRAMSGTVEEVERALARNSVRPGSVKVMIYFKEEGLPPSQIDVFQIQAVQSLKPKISASGAYYRSFRDADEFESVLRVDLYNALGRILEGEREASPRIPTDRQSVSLSPPPSSTTEDADLGYFDLVELWIMEISEVASILGRIGEFIDRLNHALATETQKVTAHQGDAGVMKEAADHIGFQLGAFSNDLRRESQLLREHQSDAFSAMARSVAIGFQDKLITPMEAESLSTQFTILAGVFDNTMENLASFRDVIKNSPRFTAKLNAARHVTVRSLEDLISIVGGSKRVVLSIRERLTLK